MLNTALAVLILAHHLQVSKVYQRQSSLAATKISNAFAVLAERFANSEIINLINVAEKSLIRYR